MDMHTDVGAAPEPFFRPVKKRKFLRRRPDRETEDSPDETESANEESAAHGFYSSDSHALQKAGDASRPTHSIPFRRPHRARRGGIEFSASSRQVTDSGHQPAAVEQTSENLEAEKIRAMSDRFTVHTGQTVDVDKHMYCPSH